MRLRAVLALLTVAMFAPASAEAASSVLARVKTVASAHWPDSPCRGREVLTYVTAASLLTYHPEFKPGWRVRADATQSTCTVRIAFDLYASLATAAKCEVLEHEFGHLAGRSHFNADGTPATDVMSPTLDLSESTADCSRAFPPVLFGIPSCTLRTPKACRWYGHPRKHHRTTNAPHPQGVRGVHQG